MRSMVGSHPVIQAAPTSVAAMIIRSHRGLPGQVYRVTNWSEFVEHFGGYQAGAFGAYAMRGFIDNGGAVAYVTRVVDDTVAAAATNTFDDGTSTVLTVTAGYRGQPDPRGPGGNNLSIRIAPNPETAGTYDLFVRQTVARQGGDGGDVGEAQPQALPGALRTGSASGKSIDRH